MRLLLDVGGSHSGRNQTGHAVSDGGPLCWPWDPSGSDEGMSTPSMFADALHELTEFSPWCLRSHSSSFEDVSMIYYIVPGSGSLEEIFF